MQMLIDGNPGAIASAGITPDMRRYVRRGAEARYVYCVCLSAHDSFSALLTGSRRTQARERGAYYSNNFPALNKLSRFVLEHPEAGKRAGLPNSLIRGKLSRKMSTVKWHCNAIDPSNPRHMHAYSYVLQEYCEMYAKNKTQTPYQNFDVYVILEEIRAELQAADAPNDV